MMQSLFVMGSGIALAFLGGYFVGYLSGHIRAMKKVSAWLDERPLFKQ